jgi:hypothetical protein
MMATIAYRAQNEIGILGAFRRARLTAHSLQVRDKLAMAKAVRVDMFKTRWLDKKTRASSSKHHSHATPENFYRVFEAFQIGELRTILPDAVRTDR